MTAYKLPAVLIPEKPNSAISVERALKQIKELLENNIFDPTVGDAESAAFLNKLQASIDDVDVMLLSIDRG